MEEEEAELDRMDIDDAGDMLSDGDEPDLDSWEALDEQHHTRSLLDAGRIDVLPNSYVGADADVDYERVDPTTGAVTDCIQPAPWGYCSDPHSPGKGMKYIVQQSFGSARIGNNCPADMPASHYCCTSNVGSGTSTE